MPVLFSFDLPLKVLEIETQASSIQDRCSIPKPHHLLFPPCLCDSLCIGLSANWSFFKAGGSLAALRHFKVQFSYHEYIYFIQDQFRGLLITALLLHVKIQIVPETHTHPCTHTHT